MFNRRPRSFFFSGITNALCFGAGITAFSPLMAFQITSFISLSGTASSFARSNFAERRELALLATYASLISTICGIRE